MYIHKLSSIQLPSKAGVSFSQYHDRRAYVHTSHTSCPHKQSLPPTGEKAMYRPPENEHQLPTAAPRFRKTAFRIYTVHMYNSYPLAARKTIYVLVAV